MANDKSEQSQTVWSLPSFSFKVDFGGIVMFFQEVSGLDGVAKPIEYRQGVASQFSRIPTPGVKQHSNIALKKGRFVQDNQFWNWFNQIKMNTIKPVPVAISLLDEMGDEHMVWTLVNAWPTKVTGADLNIATNEVSIEAIEIAHEGVTVERR